MSSSSINLMNEYLHLCSFHTLIKLYKEWGKYVGGLPIKHIDHKIILNADCCGQRHVH